MHTVTLEANARIAGTFYPAGTEITVDSLATLEAGYKAIRNEATREGIRQAGGGDQGSILGTTTDLAQVLAVGFCKLVVALSGAKTLGDADVQNVLKEFGPFAAEIASAPAGTFPFEAKGLDKVAGDVIDRAQVSTKTLAAVAV